MIVRLSTVVRPVTEKSESEARMSIIRVAIKTLSTMAAASIPRDTSGRSCRHVFTNLESVAMS